MGIGKRIREARELRGLTQKELANRVGITASAVTNYENDTSHPKEPVLYAIMQVLQVDANFLFQDHLAWKIEPPAGVAAPTGDSPEEIRAHLDQSLRAFGVIKPGNTPSRGEKYLLEAIMAMIAAYRAGQEEAKQ